MILWWLGGGLALLVFGAVVVVSGVLWVFRTLVAADDRDPRQLAAWWKSPFPDRPWPEAPRETETKAFGSGHFGEWVVDRFGLPAYAYTCDQVHDPKAVTPVNPAWQSPTNHWHQVGNDRLVALASNHGTVQVRQDEGGPSCERLRPEATAFRGGVRLPRGRQRASSPPATRGRPRRSSARSAGVRGEARGCARPGRAAGRVRAVRRRPPRGVGGGDREPPHDSSRAPVGRVLGERTLPALLSRVHPVPTHEGQDARVRASPRARRVLLHARLAGPRRASPGQHAPLRGRRVEGPRRLGPRLLVPRPFGRESTAGVIRPASPEISYDDLDRPRRSSPPSTRRRAGWRRTATASSAGEASCLPTGWPRPSRPWLPGPPGVPSCWSGGSGSTPARRRPCITPSATCPTG